MGIFTFLVCLWFKKLKFKPKTNQKVKITTKNILSQMVTQGVWIYKFIKFKLKEKCANLFYENPRNMYKMLLICLGTNKKHLNPEIMKLRV